MGSIASCEPTGEMTRSIRCPSSTRTAQLTKEQHSCSAAAILGALADLVRLRLGSLAASQVEICSCDLERSLAKSQPTISHHTKVLAEAGLLVGEKRGRRMWWRVEPERLAAVRKALGA